MRYLICLLCVAILAFGFAQRSQGSRKNLQTKRVEKAPAVTKMSEAQLRAAINKAVTPYKFDGPVGGGPYLCARTPWIDGANIDIYHPGRWDTTYNSVFFTGIHSTGSSPGEWDGAVGYVTFTPPSTGKYLILTHFSGYKISCKVTGPWGVSSSTTNTTSDDGVVITQYNATNTNHMSFSFSFSTTGTGWGMGYWYGTEFVKM